MDHTITEEQAYDVLQKNQVESEEIEPEKKPEEISEEEKTEE